MLRKSLPLLALGAALALAVGGVIHLGRLALDAMAGQERYRLPLRDVRFPPPPTQAPEALLDEVQYLAGLPDELSLLEAALPSRLAAAFALHPWVEKVERVTVGPGRQVAVLLAYRRPVLAVRHGGALRAVDGHGVLLPPDADTHGLPEYPGAAPPPRGRAGTPWGDDGVERAARAAGATAPP
jgi:hypothetical protein